MGRGCQGAERKRARADARGKGAGQKLANRANRRSVSKKMGAQNNVLIDAAIVREGRLGRGGARSQEPDGRAGGGTGVEPKASLTCGLQSKERVGSGR